MSARATAEAFARLLDDEDYERARNLLSPTCEYRSGADVHLGPHAIMASYRASGDWAAEHIDGIRYESSVRSLGPRSAAVTYVDHLEHRGRRHAYRCRQNVTVDADRMICRIEHVELPGEKEALNGFFEAVGLRRGRR